MSIFNRKNNSLQINKIINDPQSNHITIEFNDDTYLYGRVNAVSENLRRLGFDPDVVLSNMSNNKYYYSESKGYLLISNMETEHIRNAILKLYGLWLNGLRNLPPKQLIVSLRNGPSGPIKDLIEEYSRRV